VPLLLGKGTGDASACSIGLGSAEGWQLPVDPLNNTVVKEVSKDRQLLVLPPSDHIAPSAQLAPVLVKFSLELPLLLFLSLPLSPPPPSSTTITSRLACGSSTAASAREESSTSSRPLLPVSGTTEDRSLSASVSSKQHGERSLGHPPLLGQPSQKWYAFTYWPSWMNFSPVEDVLPLH
jgi:hypothetical protein